MNATRDVSLPVSLSPRRKRWIDRVRSLSVGHKLTIIYVVGIFIPLVLANGLVLRSVLRDAAQQEREFLRAAIESLAHGIVREFEPVTLAAEFVYADSVIYRVLAAEYAEFDEFIDVHREQLIPSLMKYVSIFPSISRAVVYTENPIVGAAEGYLRINEYVRSSPWYRTVSSTRTGFVTMVHIDGDPRQVLEPQTYLSAFRVLDNPAAIRAQNLILRIDVNPAIVHRAVAAADLNGEFEVVDRFGTVFASYRMGHPEGLGYSFDTPLIGHPALAGWSLRGTVAADNPALAWSIRWTMLLAVTGLSIALTSIFIVFLSRSVTHRLHTLAEKMRRVENEDFSPVTVPNTSQDEVGMLIGEFNLMANKIDSLINDGYKLEIEQNRLLVARQQAELDALQSQVNPHFLFNVLESIRMKSHIKGEHETASVVKKLSKAFRRIASWDDDLVSIEQEIAFTRDYLEIQQYRFGDTMSSTITVDSDVRDVLIPKMTIQCLVENACVHGIEQSKDDGHVEVSVARNGDGIVIRVSDNGIGCDAALVRARLVPGGLGARHIGVTNVHRRLELHYGDGFSFEFESERGHGTDVVIRIAT